MILDGRISEDTVRDLMISNLRHLLASGQGSHEQILGWCARLVALRKEQLVLWTEEDGIMEVIVF